MLVTVIIAPTDRFANANRHIAFLVAQTSRVRGADRTTSFFHARVSRITTTIFDARMGRGSDASNFRNRIGYEANSARADGTLIGNSANGVRATRRYDARIDARVVFAGLAATAVVVRRASEDARIVDADAAEETVVGGGAGH